MQTLDAKPQYVRIERTMCDWKFGFKFHLAAPSAWILNFMFFLRVAFAFVWLFAFCVTTLQHRMLFVGLQFWFTMHCEGQKAKSI